MRNKYVNFIRNKSQNIFCMAILLFVFFSCLYQSNSYASKFSLYDKVEVYNTSGIGLNLRSWYGTSYSVKTILADGTQMTVYGGPYEADGYTWWYLYGYVDGIYDSTGYYYSPGYYYGYAAEDWLKAVSTSCTYSLSSSSKSVGYSGGSSYSVSVTTSSGCSWTASSNASNASWITITSGSSGSGNGTVYYSVSANTSTSSRTGTMTIAGQTFTVTQEGEVVSCTDSYEPNDSSSAAYGHLSSGSSYSGKICTSSDVDWFKVNITSAGTISLSLTVPSSNDYYVELYSPSYSWVAGNHDVSISYNATTTGNYYIRVLGYNGSYNTTSSYTLTYTFTQSSTPKSDLVIQNLSVSPTSGNAGSSATVSFKIYNQGSGSASSSTTNIRISSSSNNVYTSDTLLASLSTSSISSGGSSSVSQTVTIPNSLSSGAYYIWVILDVNSTANQSDETNDKSYTSFTIPIPTTTPEESDLVIQNLSVSPTSGNAGSSATVSFKIYNQGSGSASSSTTNIRISSSSGDVYTSDTLLTSISTPSISSGGSSSVSQTVTIPSSLSSGTTYYIWVILDINSTANQSDESNDKSYTSFKVTTSVSSQSDLVIQNLSVSPTSGEAGSSATVSFKIYNQGSGSASSSTTNIRISSSSGDVYTSDTLLASLSTSSISSGGSSSVNQSVTIPSSLSSGTYYIWVILDANSTANQSDEDNDKSYTSFTVTTSTSSKSDLVIQNLSVSSTSGDAGSSATVSFKIYNQGSGSANSSTTNIRINSSSSSVSTSDTLLASISTPSISSGGSSSVNQSVTIPSSLSSGTYYIWVILDENSTANQSDKSNDKSYTTFTVTLPASSKSDLVIDDLSVSPTSGEAGTKATVSFTIRNQGDGDADSSTANIRINTSSSKVTTSNTKLASVDIPKISAGGTHSDNKSVTIPGDSKEATHYIWMILDVNNTANQSDVSNDTKYTTFTITTTAATPTPTPAQTDTTPPVGSLNINNGTSYTNTRAVTLTLTATDDAGVTGYYVSNNFSTPAALDSGWESITSTTSYSADISYTVSSGDGTKTLYAWYKDAAGNVSDTASDSITLVTTTSPTPTPTPSDEELLEKYAPILYMHKEEDYHPKKVDEMLSNSYLYKITKKTGQYGESYYEGEKVKKINGVKIKEITFDILMQEEINDDLHYLKLKKKPSKYTSKEDQTVYARQTSDIEDGNEKTILQYWFFYIYNDWGTTRKLGNYHEGDWEMIQIILGKNNNGILQPEKISYSFHHGGETFGWDEKDEDGEKKVKKKGNHPYVYVTLGGHGCWNTSGDHIWYQEVGESKITDCWECTDVTDSEGNVLYPKSLSNDEISEIEFITSKYAYIIEDMTDWENEDIAWIYWKGYWGKQTGRKMNNNEDYGKSGPPSPPYIDYINDVEDGGKSKNGRWYKPIKWANNPKPSNYELCSSDNSRIVIRNLNSKKDKYSDYCNWTSDLSCGNVCSNLKIIYSKEDLQFNVYSLDGEEVTLKISRYNRDTKEVHEVEFDWLEIPKNGKATLKFSPKKNPDFEIMVDNDLDNVTDRIVMPDYSTQYQR